MNQQLLLGLASVIEASRGNKLGVVALVAVLLTWVVLAFFKKAPVRTKLLAALLVLVAPIALSLAVYEAKGQCEAHLSDARFDGTAFKRFSNENSDWRSNEALCRRKCSLNSSCVAWVSSRSPPPEWNCWLYETISDTDYVDGFTSGIRMSCSHVRRIESMPAASQAQPAIPADHPKTSSG